jgi:hypothetical protein
MKKLWILCLVTLAAVFIDIVFLRSGNVYAQQNSQVTVTPVLVTNGPATVGVPGTVVGFSCATEDGRLRCYLASQ